VSATVEVRPIGRWLFGIKVITGIPDSWMSTQGPEALVIGRRWARWKARRMLAAERRWGVA
jgi:hypothetical protein